MTTPGVGVPLPPAFTSLYRLFIRSTATAVLDDPRNTKILRFLYRPSFREAAKVIRKLQSSDKLSQSERETLQGWLSRWQNRVDNTLSFLSNSSLRRGIPHKVTHNIGKVVRSLERSERTGPVRKAGRTWDPKNPPSALTRQVGLAPHHPVVRQKLFQDQAMGAMAEAIKMAEGRTGIQLGRITAKLPL